MNLTDGTTTIVLSDDLYWADEHTWHPVEQTAERTITGALVVSVASRTGGRPITLESPDESSAWHARSVVEQLLNWASIPGKTLTLTLRGMPRTVMFRHHESPAVDATPVVHYSDVQAGDPYTVSLKFLET